jgi:hypothetical protein
VSTQTIEVARPLEGVEALHREPAIAHEQPARPRRFRGHLAGEDKELVLPDRGIRPLRLEQVEVLVEEEAAVDLLAAERERFARVEPIRAE